MNLHRVALARPVVAANTMSDPSDSFTSSQPNFGEGT